MIEALKFLCFSFILVSFYVQVFTILDQTFVEPIGEIFSIGFGSDFITAINTARNQN